MSGTLLRNVDIDEQCERCGDALVLRTRAAQECDHDENGISPCEPDAQHTWHAGEDDEATCVACGLVHYVQVGLDGDGWLSAADWEDDDG